MDIHSFIIQKIEAEGRKLFGSCSSAFLDEIADAWLDTGGELSGSRYRLDKIRMLHSSAHRILDMGSGCGTFVLFALRQGYDAFGIEPEPWKLEVARQQIHRLSYDPAWTQRMIQAYGETLPFADATFDCVTTFQTIEHVQDVSACCREMMRIVKCGGCIYIRCPDFCRSTYEGHYRLPWLPGLWGKYAEWYLRRLGRPVAGLQSLTPVSRGTLTRHFRQLALEAGYVVRIVNIDYLRALRIVHLPPGIVGTIVTFPLFAAHFLRLLFRADYSIHLAVYIDKK